MQFSMSEGRCSHTADAEEDGGDGERCEDGQRHAQRQIVLSAEPEADTARFGVKENRPDRQGKP